MFIHRVFLASTLLAGLLISAACSSDGPLYEAAVEDLMLRADKVLSSDSLVSDASVQAAALEDCAQAFALGGDKRYARWCGDFLEKAAAEYGRLGYHPESYLSGEPGRMFWQVLDDATWAMYAAGAYMKVRSSLQERQCKAIEDSLFRPIAGFLMYGTEDNPKNNFVFNRIHNHGSWLVAAVGALGFALGDRTLVDKALLGTDLSGCNGGFLKQLDELFSPDGYYVEGVAYQRYALIPCLYFAKLLDRERPELHIFERNSGALLKSADAFLAQSYDGTFFLVNDCDVKSFSSADLTSSLCTIYSRDTSRKWLLDIIARYAGRVTPDEDGRLVSHDIAAGKAEPAVPHSCRLSDSAGGNAGAMMVLRDAPEGGHDGPTLCLKACGQGGYHGHFDRLSATYYDHGNAILKDYGSARYTGIPQKNGGRYTPLNRSYAMTTVAHNALVVDRRSHYGGVTPAAIPYSPRVIAFDGDPSDGLQYMSAVDSTAYEGVRMERWLALVGLPFLERPLVADIVIADSDAPHTYDLPYHYDGQMMALNADYRRAGDCLRPAGADFGYQHLWLEAEARMAVGPVRYSWLCGERMYSISTAVSGASGPVGIYILRSGAEDPDFVLRSEPAYMLSAEGSGRVVFASCLESHGHYRIQDEIYSGLAPSNTGVAVECGEAGVIVRYSFGGRGLELTIKDGSMSERVF